MTEIKKAKCCEENFVKLLEVVEVISEDVSLSSPNSCVGRSYNGHIEMCKEVLKKVLESNE